MRRPRAGDMPLSFLSPTPEKSKYSGLRVFPGFARDGQGGAIRDLRGLPASLGRIGSLELRLATRRGEIRKAQKLRYRVFFQQGGAIADMRSRMTRRDICPFDRICDHLLVVDHDFVSRLGRRKPKIVGAYRLLRQDVASRHGGFYSAQEFDVAPLLARHPDKKFLEMGRSCVHEKWRNKRTLELMWRGIWTYVRHHDMDVLIGCASLPGADAGRHAASLAFLHQHAAADAEWAVEPLSRDRLEIQELAAPVDARRAFAALPPLLKGYLRCGARVSASAVIDRMFGTTDVFAVMPIADIDKRYIEHFGGAGERAAA